MNGRKKERKSFLSLIQNSNFQKMRNFREKQNYLMDYFITLYDNQSSFISNEVYLNV